jgi:hypothetical protein
MRTTLQFVMAAAVAAVGVTQADAATFCIG